MVDRALLSPKQHQSVCEAQAAVNLWSGSVRSGKTISSLLAWFIYIATCDLPGELVVVARTRETAARNVFAPLMDPALFGEMANHVHYTAGAPTAKILGKTIHVIGASDAKSEKVLRGLTCAGAYVDEITLLREDFFVQLLNRMWGNARLFGTTNPDSPGHWLKRKYLDRLADLPDWRHWKFNLDDNPALSEDRKERIKRENVGLYYRRFVLGEWVAAEGAIYDMWDPGRHVIPWTQMPPLMDVLATGIDYGTTNATSALMLGVTNELNKVTKRTYHRLVLMDEWRYDAGLKQSRLTDSELSKRMRGWMKNDHTPYDYDINPRFTLVDPAAASFKVQLANDGVPNVTDADNDVSYGIRIVASLMASDNLVVTDRCAGFIEEATGYSWDPGATEKGQDKPIKVADHSLDAGRYAIATTENYWRRYVDLSMVA